MTGTLKTTLIQNPSSADVNITLGTSGEVTLAKSPVLNGSTSGTLTIAAPAVAGTNTQTLVAATGTLAPLISGTAQASTSGTSIDFTGIPSWVSRITVMLSGVDTSSTSQIQIQLGDATSFEVTGYSGSASGGQTGLGSTAMSAGFLIEPSTAVLAATVRNGNIVITKITGTTYSASGTMGYSNQPLSTYCGGAKTLTGTLTRVRVTTVNGTDTFTAGTINIMYE